MAVSPKDISGSDGSERTDIQREQTAGHTEDGAPTDVRRIMNAGDYPNDGQNHPKEEENNANRRQKSEPQSSNEENGKNMAAWKGFAGRVLF